MRTMRIRLKLRLTPRSRRQPAHVGIFGTAVAPQRRSWLPMFGSLAAHGVLIILVPIVADQVARTYSDDFVQPAYRVEWMKLRVPDVIFYEAPRDLSANSNRRPAPKSVERRNVSRGPSSAASAPGAGRSALAVPKGLELPSIKAPETASAAVLQPEVLPKAVLRPAPLPPLAFWARQEAPKPRRDEVRLPGRTEEAAVQPILAAPPVLAVPNKAPNLGDKNVAPTPPVLSASLPVPPSATAPVRDSSADPRNGTYDRAAGQYANLISLSAEAIRPGEIVNVPPGSTGLRSQGGGAGQVESKSGATEESGTRAQERPGPGAEANAPSSTSAPSSRGSSQEGRSTRTGAGGPKPADATQNVSPTSGALVNNTAKGPSPNTTAPGGTEAFTRIMHPPNGNFDVVVTQATVGGDLPGIPTRLSGSPVYTVYLRVGDAKEWVLAFCLPAAKNTQNSRYEVYLEDASPLSPPYPIQTTIPQSVIGQQRSAPLVFRGLLTAEGAFRNIEASEPGTTSSRIAAILAEWRFRPARKNNSPTEIEIALIIPATDDQSRPDVPKRGF